MSASVALVRPERRSDAPAVRALLTAAFAGTAEADLVERLRADGDLLLALVAEQADVVGYIAFSRLVVEGTGHGDPAIALAPLAVAPAVQRCGIGTALMRTGLDMFTKAGEALVFVVGDPSYYGRFGFVSADGFASPYAGPHFMARALAPDAPTAGVVRYPRAFADLT
jgi:putative acetyltransferase